VFEGIVTEGKLEIAWVDVLLNVLVVAEGQVCFEMDHRVGRYDQK